MRTAFASSIILAAFISCEVPYDLDLEQTESRIVIEGLLTDHPDYQRIRITRSSAFYSTGPAAKVTDAIVTVTDDLGRAISYSHYSGANPDSAGMYFPEPGFAGVVGRAYSLSVEADGKVFEASEKLLPVIPMDSIAYRANEREQDDPEVEGRFYEVLMFATEPRDQENYYLFKFFRNDTLALANDTDIYYSDDQLLAENIDGVPTPVFFSQNDSARVEVYSISRVGYVFYDDLWSLLNNDAGGMFGPIPASPRTNLSNGALGFFQVSAMTIAGLRIE